MTDSSVPLVRLRRDPSRVRTAGPDGRWGRPDGVGWGPPSAVDALPDPVAALQTTGGTATHRAGAPRHAGPDPSAAEDHRSRARRGYRVDPAPRSNGHRPPPVDPPTEPTAPVPTARGGGRHRAAPTHRRGGGASPGPGRPQHRRRRLPPGTAPPLGRVLVTAPGPTRARPGGLAGIEWRVRDVLAVLGTFLLVHRPTADLARRFSRESGAPLTGVLYGARPFGGALPGRPNVVFLLSTLVLVAGAVVLRGFQQHSAYELFMDEVQYADVANSFAEGTGPELFNAPFFLHPPLAFLYFSRFISAPQTSMTVEFVLSLRPANLLFAAANTALVVACARRVTPRWAALVAGAFYALDPFVIRFDSRLMLEAPMLFGVLAGLLCLLLAAESPTGRRRWVLLVAGGLLWGLAITTKTNAGLITGLPLLIMIVFSWGLRRREAIVVFACELGFYFSYVVWTLVTGRFLGWADQTLGGVVRAIGLVKETGFHSANAPSFSSRIVANLSLTGTSYALIGIASVFAAWFVLLSWRSLRLRGEPGDRFTDPRDLGGRVRAPGEHALAVIACWILGVLGAITYTVGLGELEEQTFYLLAVPLSVVMGLLVTRLARARQWVRWPALALVVLVLAGSAAIWWNIRSQTDDTYSRFSAWLFANVDPKTTHIALGEHTAQFVMPGYGVFPLDDVADARASNSRYGVVSTQLSELGLADITPAAIAELDRRYPVVFLAHGRTAGDLKVYDFSRPLDGSAPIGLGPQG
ncbi:phospholipid carrier-dependent glycosyltransferase [Actinomycetospora soli]|uniref:phospholipid carrier-dependent glycosyltransferase n=1 Tax=Actinomycetospora soli TaxID=2893887 RepID=UPI001E36808D|nr:phospholipid carrier-dependent glycosyltransferase [Actinomycetospora soli]MCD2190205.1 phospholipid carrier-dependent glycosyltransferase [Actinomycetospora soli]